MAVYKIPQDVEAEDTIIGFFTLKEFVYFIIIFLSLVLAWQLGKIALVLAILPLPVAFFFGLLIFLGVRNRSQPAEVYLAALLRFFLKPRRRVWSQDGYSQMVRITAPRKETKNYSDGRSKEQVKRSLDSLASLMDSRGWAAKGASFDPAIIRPEQQAESDRLIPVDQIFNPDKATDVHIYDDIMDERYNPTAQHFDEMVKEASNKIRQQALEHMKDPNYNPYPKDMHQKVVQPLDKKHQLKQESTESEPQEPETNENKTTSGMTAQPSDAILEIVEKSGDNWSVSTIAKEAERVLNDDQEVSLH